MKKEDQARPTIDCITEETPVITEQAHKKETDINWLLKDYMKTGLMKHAKNYEGQYDDVSAIDFENAMNTVAQVNTMFEELPSAFRKEFENNPSKFLEFAQNPENMPKLEAMGIEKGVDGFNLHGVKTLARVEAEAALAAAQGASGAESGATTTQPEGGET